MSWHWHDILGSMGAAMIVIAYWALQSGRLAASSLRYSLANAVGSSLILLSLVFRFNLSAFLIEFFWLLISLYGISRTMTRNRPVAECTVPECTGSAAERTEHENKPEKKRQRD